MDCPLWSATCVPSDNGGDFVRYTEEGIELIQAYGRQGESVRGMGMSNPFSFATLSPPSHGGAINLSQTNVSPTVMPPKERLIGDVGLILMPKFPATERKLWLRSWPTTRNYSSRITPGSPHRAIGFFIGERNSARGVLAAIRSTNSKIPASAGLPPVNARLHGRQRQPGFPDSGRTFPRASWRPARSPRRKSVSRRKAAPQQQCGSRGGRSGGYTEQDPEREMSASRSAGPS